MRVGELAARADVTPKALRYYEACGLVVPSRSPNGYREYCDLDVKLVQEIRVLSQLGLPVPQTEPFLTCLRLGHERGDDCPEALAAYRRGIVALEALIGPLQAKRDALAAQLDRAACRAQPADADAVPRLANPAAVPANFSGWCAQDLHGTQLPNLVLPSTDGVPVGLPDLSGWSVLYLYPLTGQPGVDLPEGWDSIPGARGCTAEACGFRDHFEELRAAGADVVYGLSAQDVAYQDELRARLRLPFATLSDPGLLLAGSLGLPTLEVGRQLMYQRLTLVARDAIIERVFYPVPAPATHAAEVVDWLRSRTDNLLARRQETR